MSRDSSDVSALTHCRCQLPLFPPVGESGLSGHDDEVRKPERKEHLSSRSGLSLDYNALVDVKDMDPAARHPHGAAHK